MPPFVTYIQKASWPVSRVLRRGEPPAAASPRLTTAAIRMRAGELFLDLDRDEIIDGEEDGQRRIAAFLPERSAQRVNGPEATFKP